ncbi:MAG TPA: chemotaxis protein CheW [Gemmatimonadaceae bacterium]|nr:chemotaxis protein CheW [Gemmatimonadaceae bacterium]
MASTETISDVPTRQLVMFRLGERPYAIQLSVVREIIPHRAGTRVPGAPSFVPGLINVRGTIITVVDLGMRLHGESSSRAEGSIVLIERGSRVVGMAVDEVLDVVRVAESELEPPAPGTESVQAAARVGGAVVMVLNLEEIVSHVLL